LHTDANGAFTFRMPQGTWQVMAPILPAMPNAPLKFNVSGDIDSAKRTVDVKSGEPAKRVDMHVEVRQ
jgi:hypothetical protein